MIKILIMDVDGTLTDGRIYMGNDGECMKAFHVKDGYGVHNLLPLKKIIPVILTGRDSEIVANRAKELKIYHIYQNIADKSSRISEIVDNISLECGERLSMANVAYCGDDCNDVASMQFVKRGGGIIGCPRDAVDTVKQIADFISEKDGGNGAVREFIEYLIQINEI